MPTDVEKTVPPIEPVEPTEFEKRLNKRRRWALGASGFLIVTGLAILGFALWRFYSERHGIGLVVPGCSLIGAGVASGIATLGLVSWAEQRERERETKEYEHREQVYGAITQFMVARFLNQGYDKIQDGQLRAMAALWASPAVVKSLANWQQGITLIHARPNLRKDPDGGVVMEDEDSELLQKSLATAIVAMRMDLATASSRDVDRVDILRSIFNQAIPHDLFDEVRPAPPVEVG